MENLSFNVLNGNYLRELSYGYFLGQDTCLNLWCFFGRTLGFSRCFCFVFFVLFFVNFWNDRQLLIAVQYQLKLTTLRSWDLLKLSKILRWGANFLKSKPFWIWCALCRCLLAIRIPKTFCLGTSVDRKCQGTKGSTGRLRSETCLTDCRITRVMMDNETIKSEILKKL